MTLQDWGAVAAIVIAAVAVIGLFKRKVYIHINPLDIYRWFNWLRDERTKFIDKYILREGDATEERTVRTIKFNGYSSQGTHSIRIYSVVQDGDDARFYVTVFSADVNGFVAATGTGYLTIDANFTGYEKEKHVVNNVRDAELLIVQSAKKCAQEIKTALSVERLLVDCQFPDEGN